MGGSSPVVLASVLAWLCGSCALANSHAQPIGRETTEANPEAHSQIKAPASQTGGWNEEIQGPDCGSIYADEFFRESGRKPTNPAKVRLSRSCFATALAECRPAKQVEISWDGRGQTTRTVIPLKDGSCAMRIVTNGRRGGPPEPTFSAIPSVKVCTFVRLDLETGKLECADEVVEAEPGDVFYPVRTDDCAETLEGNERPSRHDRACMLKALSSCSDLRANYRVPLQAFENVTTFSVLRLDISRNDANLLQENEECIISFMDYRIDSAGFGWGQACREAKEFGISLSERWNEDSLFLVPLAECNDVHYMLLKQIDDFFERDGSRGHD